MRAPEGLLRSEIASWLNEEASSLSQPGLEWKGHPPLLLIAPDHLHYIFQIPNVHLGISAAVIVLVDQNGCHTPCRSLGDPRVQPTPTAIYRLGATFTNAEISMLARCVVLSKPPSTITHGLR